MPSVVSNPEIGENNNDIFNSPAKEIINMGKRETPQLPGERLQFHLNENAEIREEDEYTENGTLLSIVSERANINKPFILNDIVQEMGATKFQAFKGMFKAYSSEKSNYIYD